MKKLTTPSLKKLAKLTTIIGASFCLLASLAWMFFTSDGLSISNQDPSKTQILFVLISLLIGMISFIYAIICFAILESRKIKFR